jgi:uncharacterized membrane protein
MAVFPAPVLSCYSLRSDRMDRIIEQGRLVFAIAIMAFGVENVVCARSGEALVPVIPWLPAIPVLEYLTGIALFAAGLSIAANIRQRLAAILLGAFFFVCVLVLQVPRVIASPFDLGIRTTAFETLSMCAAAWVLAGTLPPERRDSRRWSSALDKVLASGRYLFAVSSIVFGTAHFLVPRFIASLIPAWIPRPMFWAYFTGAAFIATGVSVATKVMDRWSAFLLGIMFLIWFLCLHLPRVLGGGPRFRDPDEWSSAFIALGMCGACWIVAWDSQRRDQA